jgi:hypothetical protein
MYYVSVIDGPRETELSGTIARLQRMIGWQVARHAPQFSFAGHLPRDDVCGGGTADAPSDISATVAWVSSAGTAMSGGLEPIRLFVPGPPASA